MKWQTDKPLHTSFLFRYSFSGVSFSLFCALYCTFYTHTSDKITCFTTQFYTMVIHQSYKGESCKQDSPPAKGRLQRHLLFRCSGILPGRAFYIIGNSNVIFYYIKKAGCLKTANLLGSFFPILSPLTYNKYRNPRIYIK